MTGKPSDFEPALKGLCPRCGARTLFDGIALAPRCRACGLGFSSFRVGNGPVAFLILILAVLITGAAILIDRVVNLPLWLHALLWFPLTLVAIVYVVRFAKAQLLADRYAAQGEALRLKANREPE